MLEELLAAKYDVTVLTRVSSNHTFPSSVKVAKVDYDSVDSLTEALRGHDACVCTITTTAISLQRNLIDAAIAAGIKRFIPSEFGSDTFNPKARQLPFYAQKVEVQEYLMKRASEDGNLTYTFICNNVFLEWGLRADFLLNLKERKAELYDGGDQRFSATSLRTVAKAVNSVLQHLEETKNRQVYIQDVAITQRKLLELAQKLTPGEQWDIKVVETAPIEEWAYGELGKQDPQVWPAILGFLKRAVFAEGYGGHFQKLDNELLGIKDMDDEQIAEILRAELAKKM